MKKKSPLQQRARPLTDKQQRFVAEYQTDLDAAKAAKRSGYSEATAKVRGYETLHHPQVSAAIRAAERKRLEGLEITAKNVLEELRLIAFTRLTSYIDIQPNGLEALVNLSELSSAEAAAIQELTIDVYTEKVGGEARQVKRIRFKMADKLRALEILCRHLGLLTDRIEISANDDFIRRLTAARDRLSSEASATKTIDVSKPN